MHKEGKKEEEERKGGGIGKGEEFVRGGEAQKEIICSHPGQRKGRWTKGFHLDWSTYLVNVSPPELS